MLSRWRCLGFDGFNTRLGDVDLERVPAHVIGVEHANRLVGFFLICHGDKGKTFRQPRNTAPLPCNLFDIPRLFC